MVPSHLEWWTRRQLDEAYFEWSELRPLVPLDEWGTESSYIDLKQADVESSDESSLDGFITKNTSHAQDLIAELRAGTTKDARKVIHARKSKAVELSLRAQKVDVSGTGANESGEGLNTEPLPLCEETVSIFNAAPTPLSTDITYDALDINRKEIRLLEVLHPRLDGHPRCWVHIYSLENGEFLGGPAEGDFCAASSHANFWEFQHLRMLLYRIRGVIRHQILLFTSTEGHTPSGRIFTASFTLSKLQGIFGAHCYELMRSRLTKPTFWSVQAKLI